MSRSGRTHKVRKPIVENPRESKKKLTGERHDGRRNPRPSYRACAPKPKRTTRK